MSQAELTYLKDVVNVIFMSGGLVGGLIASFKAINEYRLARELRQRDLQWHRGEKAHQLLSELYTQPLLRDALYMLDWDGGREYWLWGDEDEEVELDIDDVVKALRTTNTTFSESESYVRDCFDRLFEHLERIQHAMKLSIIEFEDVQQPLQYYVGKMQNNRKVFEIYLKCYGYGAVLVFLDRFGEWR